MNKIDSPLWEQHQKFMAKAIQLAEQAFEEGEVPVGAIVVHNGVTVGKGYNQVEKLGDPTAHAEMLAVSAACDTLEEKYLSDCTLYVTLEPCAMCAGALVWSKIGTIVFGASDSKAGACGSVFNIAHNKQLNHSANIIQGIMEFDCQYLLTSFFSAKRNLSS